jgi:conjugative transfer region protein TrbK
MRGRLIHWPGVLRFLAYVAVAIALIVAVVLVRHHAQPPLASMKLAAPSTTISPLVRELVRCADLGDRSGTDPNCLKAWSENRRHFFDSDVNGVSSARTLKTARGASQP